MTDERTNEQISAAIAERLFGITPITSVWTKLSKTPFASDHNAALGLVVPEMRKRGWMFEMADFSTGVDCGFVKVGFSKWASCDFGQEPRAICEAALAALDAEEVKP